VVVDALSQQFEEDGSIFPSLLVLGWLKEWHQEFLAIEVIIQLIHKLQEDTNPPKGYTL
jgi:hypothetical protein